MLKHVRARDVPILGLKRLLLITALSAEILNELIMSVRLAENTTAEM